jgi:phosphatidate cytidylyltransferase
MTAGATGRSELSLRVMSGAAMAAMAIAAAWIGGWVFAALWTAAAVVVAFEWQRIVHGASAAAPQTLTVAAAVAGGAGAFFNSWFLLAVAFAAAAPAYVALGGERPRDTAAGVVYAAALAVSAILCRGTGSAGLIVVLWLFAVVWGTDTCAYFTGRKLGGPKLWPSVSPKKTWSGAIGGLVGGAALGLLVLALAGVSLAWQHAVLALGFSVATQAGDLFESALKRRYDVKDAGSIIPGHGGVMDRLDGFIFAAALAALVGVGRAGLADAPAGLTQW